jgi:hypothetical protein
MQPTGKRRRMDDDDDDEPDKRQRTESPLEEGVWLASDDEEEAIYPFVFVEYMFWQYLRSIGAEDHPWSTKDGSIPYFTNPQDQQDFQQWWTENGFANELFQNWIALAPREGDRNFWSQLTGGWIYQDVSKRKDFFLWLVTFYQTWFLLDEEDQNAMVEELHSDSFEVSTLEDLKRKLEERPRMNELFDQDIRYPQLERFLEWQGEDAMANANQGITELQDIIPRWERELEYPNLSWMQIFSIPPDVNNPQVNGEVPQDFVDFINKGNFFLKIFLVTLVFKDSTQVTRIRPPRSRIPDPSEKVEGWFLLNYKLPTVIQRERLIALSFCYPSFLIKHSSS